MDKVIFDLKLPLYTKCVGLATVDEICVCAAFDIPDIGIEVYILNPNTGKCVKVEGWK